jgi:ribosomal protein S18 acetylase RimI-like enzyme
MGDLRIRAVAVDEHDAAGELVVDAYRSLGDVVDEFYESVLRDIVGRVETGEVLVAELDEEVVGCVTVSFGSTALSEVEDPDAATIRMLGVSSVARGRGIGEALVRHCIEQARERGCKRVRLDTARFRECHLSTAVRSTVKWTRQNDATGNGASASKVRPRAFSAAGD